MEYVVDSVHVSSRLLTAVTKENYDYFSHVGAGGSIVGRGTMLQAGMSRFRFRLKSLDFLFDLIIPAALWPRDRLSL
jgi:hypothetical protein